MTTPLLIWGASGHARVVADAVRLSGVATIVGFIDDLESRTGSTFEQSKIVGGRDALGSFVEKGVRAIHIAVGHCGARLTLAEVAISRGLSVHTVIHPSAVIAHDVALGRGTFVAAGVVVNAGSRVGQNVILNTSCSVDHDCTVEDGAHIGPGTRLGGAARVGRGAWLGIGSTVSNGVRIGEGSILGAGGVAVRDVADGHVAFGVPAKFVRYRRPSE